MSLDPAPFSFRAGKTGCLLIHGFTGTPGEMRPLGEWLVQRGYSVEGVRLAGHGTSPAHLNEKTWQDWVFSARLGYEQLAQACDTVHLIGSSMGGLVALHLAAEEDRLQGTVKVPKYGCFAHGAAQIQTEKGGGESVSPAPRQGKVVLLATPMQVAAGPQVERMVAESKSEFLDKPYRPTRYPFEVPGYDCFPRLAALQLFELIRVVQQELPQVKRPTLVIQGKQDHTIDINSAEQIMAELGTEEKELLWMEESGHLLAVDVEREKVFWAIDRFLQK
ncbi:MAG TPA: alpha/beta fold hydrolase [Firmicutes bacterium]|nr:alpha/beta fold hydrolase [Bacillota bacterium]